MTSHPDGTCGEDLGTAAAPLPGSLDPLQFACLENVGVEDSIIFLILRPLTCRQ